MKIVIIGAGTFGTAIANALKKENNIYLHSRNIKIVEEINSVRKNSEYFPNKVLSKKIQATSDDTSIYDADVVFLCIPSKFVVDFIAKTPIQSNALIINGAKGFGQDSRLISEVLSETVSNRIASFKGPSFANEMIFEVPTSFTIASKESADFDLITSLFRDELVVFDYSSDVRAVEILSIIKNIYAIIIGIVDAFYNSSNVRFLTFTKAVKEIRQILRLLQIDDSCFYLFAGIGDLGLTALNDLSRNRTLGLLIGKGFLGNEVGNKVVLEGVSAIGHLLRLLPSESYKQLILLSNLDALLKGELDTKQFVNNIIYK